MRSMQCFIKLEAGMGALNFKLIYKLAGRVHVKYKFSYFALSIEILL
jgi:hypothetical protein